MTGSPPTAERSGNPARPPAARSLSDRSIAPIAMATTSGDGSPIERDHQRHARHEAPGRRRIVLQQGSQGGLCSGTVVKVDANRKIGWVATAAHCVDVPPVMICRATISLLSPDALHYEVLDYEADSRYGNQAGTPYDFAMVRIAGVERERPLHSPRLRSGRPSKQHSDHERWLWTHIAPTDEARERQHEALRS